MPRPLRVVDPPASPGAFRRAYAAFATTRPARAISRAIGWKLDPILLRLTRGRVSTTLVFPTEVLETRGARTGHRRRNAVIYFNDGDRVIITASNAGAPRGPSWYHNLRAHPEVTFAGAPMSASEVDDPQEKRRLEDLGDRTFPAFATYRAQAATAGRAVPIIQLTPVGQR
jgi:deazaflavin-dependent oxidoreductase (nitroreductase family)